MSIDNQIQVVLIDDDLHEKVDCAKAKQISDQIKAEAKKR